MQLKRNDRSAVWRKNQHYAYLLRLDGPALAWEYLRRNADYRRDWKARDPAFGDDVVAARWGLVALIDPALDARVASVRWQGAAESQSSGGVQRPTLLTHLRAIQALDGIAAGASHRAIAVALFGRWRVSREWHPDSRLRAELRRLLERARAYSIGEYRALCGSIGLNRAQRRPSLPSVVKPAHTQRKHSRSQTRSTSAMETVVMLEQRKVIASPHYLTPEEAAAVLRCSVRTLEKHRSIGTGPRFRKAGRRILYTVPDLKAWVEGRSFDMTADPGYPSR